MGVEKSPRNFAEHPSVKERSSLQHCQTARHSRATPTSLRAPCWQVHSVSLAALEPPVIETPPRARFYYGWVMVALAAIAMTATLPGRTHGLGLITKKITDDPSLGVDETLFGKLNFW